MTEFKQELRHYCRNPKCRSKLPAPVANEREAFCARGCYSSFYLHRCRVCEKPIEQPKRGQRIICKKAKCKNAWNAKLGFGRYVAPSDAGLISDKPVNAGVQTPVKAPRGWRIVAGPELTPSQFHCATVPDGPGLGPDGLPTWEGGAYRRIEAQNRAALEAHFDKLDAAAVALDFCAGCRRTDDLVDYKMTADRWVTICRDCLVADRRALPPTPSHLIPDDLSIPQFLRRSLVEPLQLAA